jgi:hypothetical protein
MTLSLLVPWPVGQAVEAMEALRRNATSRAQVIADGEAKRGAQPDFELRTLEDQLNDPAKTDRARTAGAAVISSRTRATGPIASRGRSSE